MLLEVIYDVTAENRFTTSHISSKPEDGPTIRPRCPPGDIEMLGRQPFAGAGHADIF